MTSARFRTDLGPALGVAGCFLAAVAALVLTDRLPAAAGWALLAASAVGFTAYGVDKSAARRGARRIPESRLHLLDLLGAWPGSLLARHLFRHKTVKQPFRTVFWLTAAANIVVVAAAVVLLEG